MNTDELFGYGCKLPQPLTLDEFNKLIQEASEGSKEARDKLMIHNIRLVLYEVTTKFKNIDYDKKELVSIGNIGLVKAINTYDISKGYEFSTYAMKCIDNEVLMFLRKLKKNKNVDSIDKVIFHNKDGSELKLEDKLSDDSDIEEDYENFETREIIRGLVKQLSDRDKEIVMLRFGFYNGRIHTQQEIADKFHMTRSNVCKLINRVTIKLGKQLESVGIIELNTNSKRMEKVSKKRKRLQSIYEYFENYPREQIDEMLTKLTEEEKNLITLRYGEDLDNPSTSKNWTIEYQDKFYNSLIPKMKRLLSNPVGERKQRKLGQGKERVPQPAVIEQTPVIPKAPTYKPVKPEQIEGELVSKPKEPQEQQVTPTSTENEKMTKEDYKKLLELLRTPTFTQMMSTLSVKESIIISLRLGYVDGKYFSTESIAQFLEIDEREVVETTKKVLFLYKDCINTFLDDAIKVVTDQVDQRKVLSTKSKK